jgi:hypothetical protein
MRKQPPRKQASKNKQVQERDPTISSPGRAQSIKSFNSITSLYLGSRPAGTIPGLSWSVSFW